MSTIRAAVEVESTGAAAKGTTKEVDIITSWSYTTASSRHAKPTGHEWITILAQSVRYARLDGPTGRPTHPTKMKTMSV